MKNTFIYFTYNKNISYNDLENKLIINYDDKNYFIKKSKHIQYSIDSQNNYTNIILNTSFKLGENKIDNLLFGQLLQCYKNINYNIYKNITNLITDNNLINYDQLQQILCNLPMYYYNKEKILVDNDYFVILNKNKNIELKNIKNITNDFNTIHQKGIIIVDNNNIWIQNINNVFKFKIKLLISENYYDSNNSNLQFSKYNNFKEKLNIMYDIILIDCKSYNIDKIIDILKFIKDKTKNFILRFDQITDNNYCIKIFNYLFNTNFTFPLLNNNFDQGIKQFIFNMKKINKTVNITNLINIRRISYELNNNEEILVKNIQAKHPNTDCSELFDNIFLSLYKNIDITNDHNCPICMDKFSDHLSETECQHVFCSSCLCSSLIYSKNCPICRHKIKPNNIKTNYQNYYSKISYFENNLIQIYEKKSVGSHILVYSDNNNLCKFINNKIKNKYKAFLLNGNTESKIKKINIINQNVDNIIIMNSKDSNLAINIHNIKTIIILDHKYKFILNKESLGYDCVNNKEPINIIIYENINFLN